MATGTIKKEASPEILIEDITIASGVTSSTYYAAVSCNVAKTGYKFIGFIGPRFNQVAYSVYSVDLQGTAIVIGVRKISGSGSMDGTLNIYGRVVYMKE